MGEAKDGIEAAGRIASRLKLDVKAMRDRVDAILKYMDNVV